jgi:hypothetical protein
MTKMEHGNVKILETLTCARHVRQLSHIVGFVFAVSIKLTQAAQRDSESLKGTSKGRSYGREAEQRDAKKQVNDE